MMVRRQPNHSDQSGKGSLKPGLIWLNNLRSLTRRPSAGGRLLNQQWEDQRCWPPRIRTDVCIAHYTCFSFLLHPFFLHTSTHNLVRYLASKITKCKNIPSIDFFTDPNDVHNNIHVFPQVSTSEILNETKTSWMMTEVYGCVINKRET